VVCLAGGEVVCLAGGDVVFRDGVGLQRRCAGLGALAPDLPSPCLPSPGLGVSPLSSIARSSSRVAISVLA